MNNYVILQRRREYLKQKTAEIDFPQFLLQIIFQINPFWQQPIDLTLKREQLPYR